MEYTSKALGSREADHEILELFLRRWSPRAMTGQALEKGGVDATSRGRSLGPFKF